MLAKHGRVVIGHGEASPLRRGAHHGTSLRPSTYCGWRRPREGGEQLRPSSSGQVKTVRSNANGAEVAAGHGIVFADTEDVYEQVLMFLVGACALTATVTTRD
jgi:hypothetical protein